jgi:hypothetical protein
MALPGSDRPIGAPPTKRCWFPEARCLPWALRKMHSLWLRHLQHRVWLPQKTMLRLRAHLFLLGTTIAAWVRHILITQTSGRILPQAAPISLPVTAIAFSWYILDRRYVLAFIS